MKKNMRISIWSIGAAMMLLASGCEERIENVSGDSNVTITVANGNAMTRLSHHDNETDAIELSWTNTDRIKVYAGNSGQDFSIVNIFADGQMAEFSGTLPQGTPPYNLIYPAGKAAKSWKDNALYITGQAQKGDKNIDHLAAYNYMVITDIQYLEKLLKFENSISILKFDVVIPNDETIVPKSAELSIPPSSNMRGVAVGYTPAAGEYIYAGSVKMELKEFAPANKFTLYMAVFKIEELTNMQFSVYADEVSYHYTITGIDKASYEQGNSYAGKIEANEEAGVEVVIKVEKGSIFNNDIAAMTAVTDDWPGLGTSDSPYEIENAELLKKLVLNVNSGTDYSNTHFKLTTNIHVTADKWTTIGNAVVSWLESHVTIVANNSFKGILNGNNKTISGQIKNTNSSFGFFGCLTDGAQIKDLNITAKIEGGIATGTFAGVIIGNEAIEISNCTFSGELNGKNDTGGIVGIIQNPKAVISNCIGCGLVNGSAYRTGGIAGSNYGTIKECINYTSVMGAANDVGGICGYNLETGIVTNCKNYGAINGKSYNGCIVAVNQGSATVTNNTNYGKITGANYIGGIIGRSESRYGSGDFNITGNTNNGAVVATGGAVGGIVGDVRNSGVFGNNTNNGKVTGGSLSSTGGIIGTNSGATIYTCNKHTSNVPVKPIGNSTDTNDKYTGNKDANCPYCATH